jgi:hypothetical protein
MNSRGLDSEPVRDDRRFDADGTFFEFDRVHASVILPSQANTCS